jgi:3-phosphoshikimate 1-carboxyvinyltransferase
MSEYRVTKGQPITAKITVPGDKSISHRSLMLASLADGPCEITGLLPSSDCMATLGAMRALGIQIDELEKNNAGDPTKVLVHGKGGHFTAPTVDIDCGNSGTSMRLLSGILAALPFQSRLTGDESLSSRPMGRVIDPLTEMGATITTEGEKPGCAPLVIQGGNLKPIDYQLKVASAQVKSCVLLAGLLSKGRTSVTQPAITRDHTERMLEFFQVTSDTTNNKISIEGGQPLRAGNFNVPGDISSAAFWLVAAAAQPGAELTIENVGLNPTRNGIVTILRMMGADITETITSGQNGEPVGTVTVKGGKLHGIAIEGELIPNIIDELPVIAVAAALAEGTTTIRGAEELRVKETDRIQAVTDNLQRMGAQLTEFPDGMEITGGVPLKGASIDSYGDHRIAMSFSIAALFAEGETTINNTDCVNTSYPGFEQQLKEIAQ